MNMCSFIVWKYKYIKIKFFKSGKKRNQQSCGPLGVSCRKYAISMCLPDTQSFLQGNTQEKFLSIIDTNNQWQLLSSWAVALFLSGGPYEPCKLESLETTYIHLCKQGYKFMWHAIVPLKNLSFCIFCIRRSQLKFSQERSRICGK